MKGYSESPIGGIICSPTVDIFVAPENNPISTDSGRNFIPKNIDPKEPLILTEILEMKNQKLDLIDEKISDIEVFTNLMLSLCISANAHTRAIESNITIERG